MSKLKYIVITVIAAMIVAAVLIWLPKEQTAPPQNIATFQGDPPPQGGCSQCLGGNCYSAPCNMDCVGPPPNCETRVMGGAQAEYTRETKAKGGDYAEFYIQRVIKNNSLMESAGVEIGDVIERVNGTYAGSDLEFAKLVLRLPKGTRLTVWTKAGERKEVAL
jgi:hypothetical protein